MLHRRELMFGTINLVSACVWRGRREAAAAATALLDMATKFPSKYLCHCLEISAAVREVSLGVGSSH